MMPALYHRMATMENFNISVDITKVQPLTEIKRK